MTFYAKIRLILAKIIVGRLWDVILSLNATKKRFIKYLAPQQTFWSRSGLLKHVYPKNSCVF